MYNDKKKIKIGIIFTVTALCLIAIFNYFMYLENNDTIEVYYLNTAKGGIEPVTKKYDNTKSRTEILNRVYELFTEEQQASKVNLVSAMPIEVEVLEYSIDYTQGIMTVNFSQNYKELSNVDEINFRSALVWTFTDLEFIKKVKIQIDGYAFTTLNGKPIDYFDRTNIFVEPTIAVDKMVQRDITLYYYREFEQSKDYLVREARTATTKESTPIEEVIAIELIKGSDVEGNKNPIPSNVRIRSVKRDNAICFIDLDDNFLKGNLSEREQKIRVYSLVNSLTEVNNIEKVQILINAKKTRGFEAIDISKPLKRNYYIIK